MAELHRCEGCGRLLPGPLGPGRRCSACRTGKAFDATRDLPRPIVEPELETAQVPVTAIHFGHVLPAGDSPAAEKAMPWVMSGLLHTGALLIALFVGIVIQPPDRVKPPIENWGLPPALIAPTYVSPLVGDAPVAGPRNEGESGEIRKGSVYTDHSANLTKQPSVRAKISNIICSTGGSDIPSVKGSALTIFRTLGPGLPDGTGTGGGGRDGTGLRTGTEGRPPLFQDLVFVIDRSGSMYESFDQLKSEMIKLISRLGADQSFHIIMFAGGKPLEIASRRLAHADVEGKTGAVKFLDTVQPVGQTDPLPAIDRAFEVLSASTGRPQVICLLTDGAFTDNEKVYRYITGLNRGRGVRVFTFLYGQKDEEAQAVMKRIAQNNGGLYKYTQPN